MKKLFVILLMALGLNFSVSAQVVKTEVKPTTTVGQKVHNTFSKHKRHKGYRVKTKYANGSKHVKTVNNQTGEVKEKTKKD